MPSRPRPRPPASSAAQKAEAAVHRKVRDAHLWETAQDYVEKIADLIETVGEARVVELSRRLGVTHVTVTKTVARLRRAGLVKAQPYRAIFLTDAGRKMAEDARERHRVVHAFLLALGLSEAVAQADAEGIEHHVSQETLLAMRRFTKRASR
jgi:DtxR family manganese transport transcriptional regulator